MSMCKISAWVLQVMSVICQHRKKPHIWFIGILILMFVARKLHAQRHKWGFLPAWFVLCMQNSLVVGAYIQLPSMTIFYYLFLRCWLLWHWAYSYMTTVLDFYNSWMLHSSLTTSQLDCNLTLEKHNSDYSGSDENTCDSSSASVKIPVCAHADRHPWSLFFCVVGWIESL